MRISTILLCLRYSVNDNTNLKLSRSSADVDGCYDESEVKHPRLNLLLIDVPLILNEIHLLNNNSTVKNNSIKTCLCGVNAQ